MAMKKSMDTASVSTQQSEIPAFNKNQVLMCTTHGKVYAVNKKDGSRLWRQDFPCSNLGGIVSLFVTDNDTVIVGGNGKTAAMDLYTGQTKWTNEMKGFGYDEVSVLATPSRYLLPKIQPQVNHYDDEAGAAGAPPSYEEQQIEKQIVFGCSRGKVLALDSETGETAWKYDCPGGGYNIPTLLVEPSSHDTEHPFQVVYIGCGRWVYCLRALTGEVVWNAKVSNSMFGLGFMCLATPWSSRLTAEAHTSFSSTPLAQAREMERRKHSSGGD
ncbi:unnamed protein product [Cunninghamella echinulata]